IEASGQPADGERLCLAAHVLARILERRTRTPEGLLAGFEFRRKSNRRKIGQGHGAARDASSAVNYLKTQSVGEGILFRFMDFYEYVFLILGRNLATRINLGPIEN